MNKKYIIISLSILVILLVVVVILIPQYSQNSLITSPQNTPSFFPLEKVRSIISTLPIINEIAEIKEIVTNNEPTTSITYSLNKVVTEEVSNFGFINIGTTTYPYFLSKEGYVKVLENDGTRLFYGNKIENLKDGFLVSNTNNYYFYLKTNTAFKQLTIPKTSSSTPKIIDLNQNILDLLPTLDNKILGSEVADSNFTLKLLNPDFTNQKIVWENPLKEWVVLPGIDKVFIQSKPSSGLSGYLYNLNLNNLKTTEILNNVLGLMSKTSPDGKYTLLTNSVNGKITTLLYENIVDGDVYETSFNTLPDKCSWIDSRLLICANPDNLPLASYPDDWYQGQVRFRDNIWLLGADKAIAHLLINVGDEEYTEQIDAINLKVSPDRSKLYFINKIDSTLWSLDLSGFDF